MKFLSFNLEGKNYFGGIKNDGIVNLTKRVKDVVDLRDAIRQEKLSDLSKLISTCDSDYSFKDIQFIL